MNATVRYSATIVQSPDVQVLVSTYDALDGYGVAWSGTIQSTTRGDDGRVRIFEGLANVDRHGVYFDNHEDAIADAVSWFDGTDSDNSTCQTCGHDLSGYEFKCGICDLCAQHYGN